MREFIRQRLLEAIKSRHWNEESYPERIEQSTFQELGPEVKTLVDDRIKFIESLEFSEKKPQKIGIWIYKAPVEVKHPPFEKRDKGNLLLGIINNNNMTTLYWKHKKEGEYDFQIEFADLVEFSKSEFYDPVSNPITINNIKQWQMSKSGVIPTKRENYKKISLKDGSKIRYYEDSNKFETLDGNPLKLDDIFDNLPDDLQDKVIELLENKK